MTDKAQLDSAVAVSKKKALKIATMPVRDVIRELYLIRERLETLIAQFERFQRENT